MNARRRFELRFGGGSGWRPDDLEFLVEEREEPRHAPPVGTLSRRTAITPCRSLAMFCTRADAVIGDIKDRKAGGGTRA